MENSPKIAGVSPIHGASFRAEQPPKAIRQLIHRWLTDEEAEKIHSQFQKVCKPDLQVLWSGMLRENAQQWADAHHYQTLTSALGPLLHPSDPSLPSYLKSQKARSKYLHGASIIYAWFISHGRQVTVLSRPPPQRFHPSGKVFYQKYEQPIIQGKIGNRAVERIVLFHPTVEAAKNFSYEMWPHDGVSLWTRRFGTLDAVGSWRAVKISKHISQMKVLEQAEPLLKSALSMKSGRTGGVKTSGSPAGNVKKEKKKRRKKVNKDLQTGSNVTMSKTAKNEPPMSTGAVSNATGTHGKERHLKSGTATKMAQTKNKPEKVIS